MKRVLLGLGILAFFVSPSANAAEGNTVYYQWNDARKVHEVVSLKNRKTVNLYVCSEPDTTGTRMIFWVTHDHDDAIVVGSVVLGYRLGKKRLWGTVWYRLGEKLNWVPLMPRTRPRIYRQNEKSGTYLAEDGPWDWPEGHSLLDGGEKEIVPIDLVLPKALEPATPRPRPAKPGPEVMASPKPELSPTIQKPKVVPTPVEPAPVTPTVPPTSSPVVVGENDPDISCEIEISPATAFVGESVILSMHTSGNVTSAQLDGAAVDFPTVLRSKVVDEKPGKHTIYGIVTSRRGVANCKQTLIVRAGGR